MKSKKTSREPQVRGTGAGDGIARQDSVPDVGATPSVQTLRGWTRGSRGWRIVALAILLLLATQLRYSERRAVRERDQVTAALRAEESRRVAAERELDGQRSTLERQARLRHQLERERDQLKAALRLATQRPTDQELPSEAEDEDDDGFEEETSAEVMIEESPPSDEKPPDPASERSPGIARADFAKVMPLLVAVLKPEEVQGRKGLRIGDSEDLPIELQKIGLQQGDVITNIDRVPVDDAVQFADALDTFREEPGFALRIVRGAQSEWLRVNILGDVPANSVNESSQTASVEEAPKKEALPR